MNGGLSQFSRVLDSAMPMPRSTFKVWRLLDNGLSVIDQISADTLPDIEDELAKPSYYGNRYIVEETETLRGGKALHHYIIRRCKWKGHYSDFGHKIYPHRADREFSVQVKAFDPVQPWRWTPGCDVVGKPEYIEASRNASRADVATHPIGDSHDN